jgi:hypothetical protein
MNKRNLNHESIPAWIQTVTLQAEKTTNLPKTVAQNQSNNHMKPLTRFLTYSEPNENTKNKI